MLRAKSQTDQQAQPAYTNLQPEAPDTGESGIPREVRLCSRGDRGNSDDKTASDERFYRRAFVIDKYGISVSTLYRWIAANRFPAPIQLGPGVVAWRATDLAAFDEDPAGWGTRHGGQ